MWTTLCKYKQSYAKKQKFTKAYEARNTKKNEEMRGYATMIKILFICHGNICRSPMAEYVMKDLVKKSNLSDQFHISSAATSTEEIGNPVHRGTREKLAQAGIACEGHHARQMTRADYDGYDYLIGMDEWNIRNIKRITGGDPEGKIFKMMSFAGSSRDVADPWYTGDFEATWKDVTEGCQGLLQYILEENGKASKK